MKKQYLFAIICGLLFANGIKSVAEESSNVIINEIMPSNIDLFVDPSWNFGSFIELYNPTDKPISLAYYCLSDDPSDTRKWRMPATIGSIPAHGFKAIWFDHNDQYCQTQCQFKLNVEEGGNISLYDNNGHLLDSQDYPVTIHRCSYARKTDGGDEWGWTSEATPEKTNNTSKFADEQLAKPKVNEPGQVFNSSLKIEVSIPEGATLRYTTNGTTPTLTNGSTSTNGQFTITQTKVYRFRLFQDGKLPSDITTCSYILKGSKTFNAPIISVVTDDKNINGKDYGIFVKGNGHGRAGRGQGERCNWNMDWDRPVSFEYIPDGGKAVLSQEVNMSAVGGWSRANTPHSFKLKANKIYGEKFMSYPLFEDKPYNKNKTLQIRNGGNDNYCRIKDAALQMIVARSGIDVDWQDYKPIFVYINGTLYEVLNMREPNNKHWAYANKGIDDDYMDQFEYDPDSGYVQQEGTKAKFKEWYDLSKNASNNTTYEKIKQIVDIDEFINYFAIEMFLGGNDWIGNSNNVKGYRSNQDDINSKFRFTLFDLDAAFQITTGDGWWTQPQNMFTYIENNKTHQNQYPLYEPDGRQKSAKQYEIELITIWLNMLNNAYFRKQFIDTFCLVSGSVFDPTFAKNIITEVTKHANEVMKQGKGGSADNSANELNKKLTASYQNTMIEYLKSYSRMKLSSTTKFTAKFSTDTETAKIYLNGIPVPTNKFNGALFAPAKLLAVAPAGYKFAGWKDVSKSKIISTEEEYTLPTNSTVNIIATFQKLSEEELKEQFITPIRINEVSAENDSYINDLGKKGAWVELYNTTDQAIDIAGMYLSDNKSKPHKYQFMKNENINTIIRPHGFLIVWCDKKDAINQIHTSFKLNNDDGSILMLTAEDDSWTDIFEYNEQYTNQTYGRYPDGANQMMVMGVSTIGRTNIKSTYDEPFITDIENISTGEIADINNGIYDLQGRKISTRMNLPAGIYIQNGKKVLIMTK